MSAMGVGSKGAPEASDENQYTVELRTMTESAWAVQSDGEKVFGISQEFISMSSRRQWTRVPGYPYDVDQTNSYLHRPHIICDYDL